MLKFNNHLGTMYIGKDYLVNLVGSCVVNSFGVAAMAVRNPGQSLQQTLFKKEALSKGIGIKTIRDKISIDIHIIVTYGTNISEIVKSISHKVRYTVEQMTGIDVAFVNVFVDGMKS